jgi:hypothetical protein
VSKDPQALIEMGLLGLELEEHPDAKAVTAPLDSESPFTKNDLRATSMTSRALSTSTISCIRFPYVSVCAQIILTPLTALVIFE